MSDQMQATKVRRVPRGKGLRVGSPPGEPSSARGHCLVYFHLSVPPPESDRSVHFTLIFLKEEHVRLPSVP